MGFLVIIVPPSFKKLTLEKYYFPTDDLYTNISELLLMPVYNASPKYIIQYPHHKTFLLIFFLRTLRVINKVHSSMRSINRSPPSWLPPSILLKEIGKEIL